MRIPADCILIDGMDIKCDESMYRGGKKEVVKKISETKEQHIRENPDPFLLTRSLVLSGSGRAVVCAVGKRTRWFFENPVEDLEDDNVDTPLTIKLKKLVEVITNYAQIAAFFIFSTMLIFLSLRIIFSGKTDLLSNETLKNLLRCFTTAVAVIIVSVPDGLKLAV